MPKKQVQVEVSSSVYDILQAVAKVISDGKAAAKLGGNQVQLIASIGGALVTDLAPVIGELAQIQSDIAESKPAVLEAVLASVPDLLAAIQA